jgi:hypothetical protein
VSPTGSCRYANSDGGQTTALSDWPPSLSCRAEDTCFDGPAISDSESPMRPDRDQRRTHAAKAASSGDRENFATFAPICRKPKVENNRRPGRARRREGSCDAAIRLESEAKRKCQPHVGKYIFDPIRKSSTQIRSNLLGFVEEQTLRSPISSRGTRC